VKSSGIEPVLAIMTVPATEAPGAMFAALRIAWPSFEFDVEKVAPAAALT
jgi:hypothetical protein